MKLPESASAQDEYPNRLLKTAGYHAALGPGFCCMLMYDPISVRCGMCCIASAAVIVFCAVV